MDENVHFYPHTKKLISQLVKLGKPLQVQVSQGFGAHPQQLERANSSTLVSPLAGVPGRASQPETLRVLRALRDGASQFPEIKSVMR